MNKGCLVALGLVLLLSQLGLTTLITRVVANSDTVRWSKVSIPIEGKPGNWVLADDSDVQKLTMAIDGSLYCYAKVSGDNLLFKSNDDGRSWVETGYDGGAIAGVVCSSVNANIIYVTDGSHVRRSEDAGGSFHTVADTTLPTLDANESITCLDVGYRDGDPYVFIGTADADNGDFGGVYYTVDAGFEAQWTDLEVGNYDVYSIACSPEFANEFQIIAVVTDEAHTWVVNNYGNVGDWFEVAELLSLSGGSFDIVGASNICFPSNSDDEFFVGVAGDSVDGGVYRVKSNAAYRLGDVDADIISLDVIGKVGNTRLIAGAQGDCEVFYSSDDGDSWDIPDKPPSGDGPTYVVMADAFAGSGRAYAATSGTGGAFSCTADGGVTWNQLGLIDTALSTIVDLAPSPNYSQDDTLFMLTFDGEHSLWRSLNGGAGWERVFTSALAGVDSIDLVGLSPRYGTGSQVVFIAGSGNGNSAIWKSTDNGQSFIRRSAPSVIDTWAVVNDNTLFIGSFDGSNALVYRTYNSGLNYSTPAAAGSQPLSSVVLSPDYNEDRTILVGNRNGWVFWSDDSGTSFEPLPPDAASPPLSGSITVAFDPEFSSNSTVYAASDTPDKGIYRFVINESTNWERIDGSLPEGGMLGQVRVSTEGTLYATNFKADGGMERCLNPTYPLAPTFETVTSGLDDGATLIGLWLHGNQLWSIDTASTRLMTFTDSLTEPVILTSPANKATGIGTIVNNEIANVSLDWEVLTGATKYHWQLDHDRDFSSVPTGFEGDTKASSARLPPLEPATKYYWRVRATGPAFSLWSDKWSFTTSIGAPRLYSPEAGASGVGLKPLFQWSSTAWATSYELMVSTNASFSSPLISMTGGKALPSTAWLCDTELDYNTTYYWKVRAVGSDTYSPWSDTGIFTTIPEPTILPPEPPLLQSPPLGASDVSLNPSFAWSGADWATSYELMVSTSASFSSPLISLTGGKALSGTAWLCDTDLDYETTYYWRVRGVGSSTSSPWSDTGIFTTISEPAIPPPEPPVLQSPAFGASDVGLEPSFAWSGADWATSYELMVSTNASFSSPLISLTGGKALSSTAWLCDTELDYDTTYYWKVKAVGADTYSPWSDTGIFTTVSEPTTLPLEPPLLEDPSPGASNVRLTPSFAWSGADWATEYEFILAKDDRFRKTVVKRTGSSALETNVYLCEEELDYNTTYYWKVRAVGSDIYSPWSDAGIFTTVSEPTTLPPEPPLLQSPSPGASNVGLIPTFAWSGADWATGYELVVSTNASFSNLLVSMTGGKALPSTAWLCDVDLDYNTTYYWKVRAVGSDTYSPWSDTGIFTSRSEPMILPLEPPLLQAPSPGASNVGLNPSFAWSGADWATGYEFILAKDDRFGGKIVERTGRNALKTNVYLCEEKLDYNITYYWEVRAVGSDIYSPWSDTGIFTTVSEPAIPGWIKWLMYLGGGLLLIMVAMLVTMIILGVKIAKPNPNMLTL